ncbi:hypothetical protein LXA43DRAFT_566452 [Ganoderma leucocontextum]|nr:hypothetical protein LXA43DRAFT_566452 [Ganoderma leucocontextum]
MASTDHGNVDNADDLLTYLPNGHRFLTRVPYTTGESGGVAVLAVISCISATVLVLLLVAIGISAWNTRKSSSANLFVRSHVAAYFLSLLFCEVAQTIGSIMSIRWIQEKAVSYEAYCTVQGAFKHLADVGTACWSLIIAFNTFWILFLKWQPGKLMFISTVLTGWAFIVAIVASGPTAIQREDAGPFYAISGYWCWISDQYSAERITMDYMIMFLSVLLSFMMYSLIFFRLRGDLLGQGWRVRLRRQRDLPENMPRSVDTHVINITRGMLLYPVAYTVLLLPIAVCRFAEWSGHQVPFGATIFSDAIFLLSGFVDVVLFLTTRRVLPMHTLLPRRVSTLFPSFGGESFSATGTYSMASYTTHSEKPVPCEDSDGARNTQVPPLAHSPARTRSTPSSPQFTGSSTSQHSTRAPRRSSDKEEADVTSLAMYDEEQKCPRVVSDPASLMIFIPATALG